MCKIGICVIYAAAFLVSMIKSARWDEKISLQAIYDDLKDIFPKNEVMKDVLFLHKDIIDIIDMKRYSTPSQYYRYRFSHGRYKRRSHDEGTYSESPLDLAGQVDDLTTINLDIHIDIAMIGFPASTVEFVRDYWFDNLGRKERVVYTTGSNEHIFTYTDADATISYHYHMVQVSYTVADVIRDRFRAMTQHSTPHDLMSSNQSTYIFHTWEMEESLEALSETILSIHGKSEADKDGSSKAITLKPSATMFILNIHDMVPDGYQYSYCTDFTTEELKLIRENPKLVDKAKAIQNEELRQTRVDKSPDASDKTLPQCSTAIINNFKAVLRSDVVQSTAPLVNITTSGLHWRDAIQVTKEWSKAYAADTASMIDDPALHFTLESRVMKILLSKHSSRINRRKSQLVDALLSTQAVVTSDLHTCSAATWTGSSRLLWMDINSIIGGDASKTQSLVPSSLSSSEWLLLGHSTKQVDVQKEIIFLENTIRRHLDTTISSYKTSDCPIDILNDLSSVDNGMKGRAEYFSSVRFQFTSPRYSYYSTPATSGICSHFLEEVVYLNITLESSHEMRRLYDVYIDPSSASADTIPSNVQNLVQESSRLHRRMLAEAYRLVYHTETGDAISYGSELSEKHTTAASVMMSDKALNYLAHLSGKILHLTRYFISPPMILVNNPVIKSIDPSSMWSTSLPNPLIDAKVDVTVYLISLKDPQRNKKPQFEYETFFRELQRMRLSSQQMTLTVQPIDISQEIELASAFAMCKTHTHMIEAGRSKGYLNEQCVLSYIHKKDTSSSSTSSSNLMEGKRSPAAMPSSSSTRAVSPSSSNSRRGASSAYSSQSDTKASTSGLKVHQVPVFVLLVDENEALSLENGDLARRVGNTVIIIQNIQSPSNLPINNALLAVAEVIGGLPPSNIGHHGFITTDTLLSNLFQHDQLHRTFEHELDDAISYNYPVYQHSLGHGSSPRFSNYGGDMTPIFSDLDVDIVHRGRVLRSLSLATATMKQYILTIRLEIHHFFADQPDRKQRADDHVHKFIQLFSNHVAEALVHTSNQRWDKAVELSNAVYIIASHPQEILSIEAIKQQPAPIAITSHTTTDTISSSSSYMSHMMALVMPIMYGIIAYIIIIASRLGIQRIKPSRSSSSTTTASIAMHVESSSMSSAASYI